MEMILLHELAHVRRRDNLVNLLQRLVESALFFHPAVWLISTWVRREREYCCDEAVVRHTGEPQRYVELLAGLAVNCLTGGELECLLASPSEVATSAMARCDVIGRIRYIMKKEDESMHVSRRLVGVILTTLIAAALLIGWYGPQAGADGPGAGTLQPRSLSGRDASDSGLETDSFLLAAESGTTRAIELAGEKQTADDGQGIPVVLPSFSHQVRLTAIVQTAQGREAWFNDASRGARATFSEGARFSVPPHEYLIRRIRSQSVELLIDADQRTELKLDQILSGDTTAQVVRLIREAGRQGVIVQIGPDQEKRGCVRRQHFLVSRANRPIGQGR